MEGDQSQCSNLLNFTGRRVLVTGGVQGIGLAVVKLFVQLKATVIVFDKNETLLDQLNRDLPEVKGIKIDLSDWQETKKVTESILPIHHLVNNAVYAELQKVLDIDEGTVDKMFAVNYKAVLNVSQVVAKGMIQNEIRGTIVSMSSIIDQTAIEKCTMYSSMKGALVMLTKNLALELGQFGIRANFIRPSMVNTELIANLPEHVKRSVTKLFLDRMTFKKLPETVDVAKCVIFLSSDWANMITGTGLTVDGGFDIS